MRDKIWKYKILAYLQTLGLMIYYKMENITFYQDFLEQF